MDQHTTIRSSTWYRVPFGQRLINPDAPTFVISRSHGPENRDAARRRFLAGLAGLGS